MQSLLTVWRFLLLASIFAFPQLLGILLYFRLTRAPRWIAAIASALAPAVVFVLLAPIFLFAGAREAQASGDGCGMLAFGAQLVLFAGTIIQLVLAISTQLVLSARRRHKVSS